MSREVTPSESSNHNGNVKSQMYEDHMADPTDYL